MAFSMTGFGRGQAFDQEQHITVEIKSVNNRYCDIQIRQPRILAPIENKIRELIARRLSRGKIDVFISYEDNRQGAAIVRADTNLALGYVEAVRTIAKAAGLPDGLTASYVARFNDVLKTETTLMAEDQVWELIQAALVAALDMICSMRAREGTKLAADIAAKIDLLQADQAALKQRAPLVPQEYRQRLTQRVEELLKDDAAVFYDEQRVHAEVALFADRCAIDEELVRLDSHFHQFKLMLKESTPIGKKLDFLIQEINREINTIGSKANDLEMTGLVVKMKSELEKVREQVQNLE